MHTRDQLTAATRIILVAFIWGHCFTIIAAQRSSSFCQDNSVLTNGYITYSVGRFYSQTQLRDGTTKRFNCHTGWTLLGPSTARCSRGKWSARSPRCVPDSCNALDEEANNYLAVYYSEDPQSRGKYAHGVEAHTYCLWEHITVAGEEYPVCQHGKWTPNIPLCLHQDQVDEPCVIEKNSISGEVEILNQHEIPEDGIVPHYGVLEFRCVPGYTLAGSSITTCLDKRWSQQFPECIPNADYETCGQTSGNTQSRQRGGGRRRRPGKLRARRLVDGIEAQDAAWPWQVAIYVKTADNEWGYSCGGSLIGKEWVLTAAHCFRQDQEIRNVQIRLGLTHRMRHAERPREQRILLDGLYIHQYYSWNSYIDYDIAILHLAKPAVLTPFVRTICLPDVYNGGNYDETLGLVKENVFGMVTGWGHSSSVDFKNMTAQYVIEHNKKLQQLEVPIKKNITCTKSLEQRGELPEYYTERMFCAGYNKRGRGPCFGDSGGPVVIKRTTTVANSTETLTRWTQIGLVSSTAGGCALKGVYTHYTDVTKMMNWIDDVLHSTITPFRETVTMFI